MLTMQEQREQNEWFEGLRHAREMRERHEAEISPIPAFDPHALAMALQLADVLEADEDFMEWDGKVCITCWLRAEVQRELGSQP